MSQLRNTFVFQLLYFSRLHSKLFPIIESCKWKTDFLTTSLWIEDFELFWNIIWNWIIVVRLLILEFHTKILSLITKSLNFWQDCAQFFQPFLQRLKNTSKRSKILKFGPRIIKWRIPMSLCIKMSVNWTPWKSCDTKPTFLSYNFFTNICNNAFNGLSLLNHNALVLLF